MPNFKYKIRDKFGTALSGVILASERMAAAKQLEQMGYTIISVEAYKASAINIFEKIRGVSLKELVLFTRQFESLMKAGIPLIGCLTALKEQTKNPVFKEMISQIIRDIESGSSLAIALSKHPKAFSNIYTSAVKAGEASGTLDENLSRLGSLLEHDMDIGMQISSAVRYPILALCAMIIGMMIIVSFVIPKLVVIFDQFRGDLPLPTKILIGMNIIVTKYWFLALVVIGAIVFAVINFIKTKNGRLYLDKLKIKVPVVGPIIYMLTMSRFCYICAILIKSGLAIIGILDMAASACNNAIVSRAIENIKTAVTEGKGMSEPMRVSGMFAPVVVQMVAVGEQTGKVDELLFKASEYYDKETGYHIKNITSLIEPILIVILGAGVLFMALAVFLPIWNMFKLVQT